jgi:hypothetical protein
VPLVVAELGVSAGQLTRYEDGQTILPTMLLRPVAALYGLNMADLLGRLGLLDVSEAPAAGPRVRHAARWRKTTTA